MPEYQTMTEMAATQLRKAIMMGDLPPGTRLIPVKLENELNLSRVSIREAIRELSGSALVETVMNVGAHVASPPSLDEIKEIFEVRLLVEPKLAAQASKNISDEGVSILEGLYQEMESDPQPGRNFFMLNREFHQTLYLASGRRFLCRIVSQFMDQILLFRSRGTRSQFDFHATNLEHQQIIEAIRAGNVKEIKAKTVSHIKRGLADIIRRST
ncbi:MAG: GntR family transcriptional regulator [Desulfobacteraceae bacterium]|nr:GntR family transcriptional regulator [Desulfobacteraceae bacterium]